MFADHQVDGRGPPVVRGPQVENRWFKIIWIQGFESTTLGVYAISYHKLIIHFMQTIHKTQDYDNNNDNDYDNDKDY